MGGLEQAAAEAGPPAAHNFSGVWDKVRICLDGEPPGLALMCGLERASAKAGPPAARNSSGQGDAYKP